MSKLSKVWKPTRAPKYDLVVLSRTEYEVVLGRTEYEYDRKKMNPVRVSTRYDHFTSSEVVLVRGRIRRPSPGKVPSVCTLINPAFGL